MKTVLYLSGAVAVWIAYKGKRAINMHTESIVAPPNHPYTPCPWISTRNPYVYVVADAEQEEIDLCPYSIPNSWLLRQSHLRAVRARLLRRFPNSIVDNEPMSNHSAWIVQHLNLPETTQDWLRWVEQSHVVFKSMHSITDMLGGFFRIDTKPCLTLSYSNDYVKHTYCENRRALFTRAVNKSTADSIVLQVEETLGHLAKVGMVHEPIPVYAVGVPDAVLSSIDSLAHVKNIIACESWLSTIPTAGKQLDASCRARYQKELVLSRELIANRAKHLPGVSVNAESLLGKYQAVRHRLYSKRITRAALSVAVVAVSVGVHSELSKRDTHKVLHVQRQAMTTAISDLSSELKSIHPDAINLSQRLFDIATVASSSGNTVAHLITVLSEVLSANRSIDLSSMRWVAGSSGAMYSNDAALVEPIVGELSALEIEPVTNQSQAHQFAELAVSFRETTEVGDEPVDVLKVQMTGTLSPELTLSEQHHSFEQLLDSLTSNRQIKQLRVYESPATQVGLLSTSSGSASVARSFKIQFEFYGYSLGAERFVVSDSERAGL